MDIVALLLVGLLGVLSPANWLVETIARRNLRERLESAESLDLRIDNRPVHQALAGKVDQVRLAARDFELIEGVNIALLDIETDAINVDLGNLRSQTFREALEAPLQGAVHLVVTEQDLNEALANPRLKARVQSYLDELTPKPLRSRVENYQLATATIDFAPDQFTFKISLAKPDTADTITLELSTGLTVAQGRYLQIVDPVIRLGDRRISPRLLQGFVDNFNQQLDLARLESEGVTVRMLRWDITDDALDLAIFARVEPTN